MRFRRSRQATISDLVNLRAYYTAALDDDWLIKPGANLAELPKGVQAFARAAFDVRGLVQLAGTTAAKETGIDFPKAITGIKIGAKVRKLHFLQGASWSAAVDTKIGEYVLHYADGTTFTVPILYGRSVVDWWITGGSPVPTDAQIAWTGENAASHKIGYKIQLYTYTVNNPRPDVELASLDFVSTFSASAPFLVALTYEPVKTDYEWFDAIKIWNGITPRSKQATPDLVDLGAYFNTSLDNNWFDHAGHNFQEVPKGVQVLDGTAFELRGLIQLAGTQSLKISGVALPEAVKGIKVGRKGVKIHFLQACGFSASDGQEDRGVCHSLRQRCDAQRPHRLRKERVGLVGSGHRRQADGGQGSLEGELPQPRVDGILRASDPLHVGQPAARRGNRHDRLRLQRRGSRAAVDGHQHRARGEVL